MSDCHLDWFGFYIMSAVVQRVLAKAFESCTLFDFQYIADVSADY